MSAAEAASPLVRFTLHLLEAESLGELASRLCQQMVESFGATWARVVDGDRCSGSAGGSFDDAELVQWQFSLASARSGSRAVHLHIGLAADEDIGLIRHQFMDLVAIARRSYLNALRLARETRIAREDALTGLDNRRSVEARALELFAEASRTGMVISVMMIDLDHFKTVNDERGHAEGDEVLRTAASCMQRELRENDCVGRWGGDEFIVLLPGINGAAAELIAERLRARFDAEPSSYEASMSIGVADTNQLPEAERHGLAPLVAAADACLYEGKRAGRNRVWRRLGPEETTASVAV